MMRLLVSVISSYILVTSSSSIQCAEAGGVRIKGGIYFDQVWTPEKSPYVLEGNVKLGKGTKLKVLPGTRVIGNGHVFRIDGEAFFYGSEDRLVTIEEVNFVAGKSNLGGLYLSFCSISGGSVYSHQYFDGKKGSVNITDSVLLQVEPIYLFYPPRNMSIARNIFDRCGGISAGTDGVFVSVTNNLFHAQTTDYAVKNWARYPFIISQDESDDGKNHWYPMDMEVQFNTFSCKDRIALRLEPKYNDAYLLNARNNFFGSSDPSVVKSMIFDRENNAEISSKIEYRPFLTKRHPKTPHRDGLRCD